MTEEEVRAVVETAHKAGRPVVAHAHREDEIRIGVKYNVDCFEHTGLATEPGYPEDILQGLRKRDQTLAWCPTIVLLQPDRRPTPHRAPAERRRRGQERGEGQVIGNGIERRRRGLPIL